MLWWSERSQKTGHNPQKAVTNNRKVALADILLFSFSWCQLSLPSIKLETKYLKIHSLPTFSSLMRDSTLWTYILKFLALMRFKVKMFLLTFTKGLYKYIEKDFFYKSEMRFDRSLASSFSRYSRANRIYFYQYFLI